MYQTHKRSPKPNEKVKIMIVEDNKDTAETESQVLSKVGFETVHVSDGAKAFDEMKILKPDIVILDLELPGRTGDQIQEEMLKDSDLKHVPVIICSVHLTDSTDPDNLGNKYLNVFHRHTGAAPERIVKKMSEDSTIKDLIIEVTVACGETFGGIPNGLKQYWEKTSPYQQPPYGVLPEPN